VGSVKPIPKGTIKRRAFAKRAKEAGLCECGHSKPVDGKTHCADCLERSTAIRQARIAAGMCSACGQIPNFQGLRCGNCIQKKKTRAQQLKQECIAAYGGKCVCCGVVELAFLTLDHIKDDGSLDRKITGAGYRFYQFLKTRGYPQDRFLQVLCWNCQWGKRIYGVCPHQQARKAAVGL